MNVSCCKQTAWHFRAHKVPESSVYALETYTTESIALAAIGHPPQNPPPACHSRRLQAAGRANKERTPHCLPPAYPARPVGIPGLPGIRRALGLGIRVGRSPRDSRPARGFDVVRERHSSPFGPMHRIRDSGSREKVLSPAAQERFLRHAV